MRRLLSAVSIWAIFPLRIFGQPADSSRFQQVAIDCSSAGKPQRVIIRLPHPEGKKAIRVTGGTYDSANELVLIEDFRGTASVRAEF